MIAPILSKHHSNMTNLTQHPIKVEKRQMSFFLEIYCKGCNLDSKVALPKTRKINYKWENWIVLVNKRKCYFIHSYLRLICNVISSDSCSFHDINDILSILSTRCIIYGQKSLEVNRSLSDDSVVKHSIM